MKNLFCITAIILLQKTSANAQAAFTDATTADMYYNYSTSVQNTGIDNLIEAGVTYELAVWDGDTPGLGYFVDDGVSTYTSSFGLHYNDAVDPDVSLMLNTCSGTVVWGVIVYYSGAAGGLIWELGYFNTLTYAYTYHSSGFISGSYATAVNIDRNELNNFIITWDNAAGNILYVTGEPDCGSGRPDVDHTGCGVLTLNNTSDDFMPDVTLYHDGSTREVAVFTFVDNSSGDLMVHEEDFSDLIACSSVSSPSSVASPNVSAFYYPRISSASQATGWTTSAPWMIVVEDNDGTDYWIEGFTNSWNGGSPTVISHVYNDGNLTDNSPHQINLYIPNIAPVVAHSDELGDALFVGWTFKNRDGSNGILYNLSSGGVGERDANYPIVPGPADYDGYLAPSATYWEVPTSLSTSSPHWDYGVLSIACVYNLSLAYYNQIEGRVYVKRVYPTASHLRLSQNKNADLRIYPNPGCGRFVIDGISSPAKIEVQNVLGEIIYSQKVYSSRTEINLAANSEGIYFLKIESEEQTTNEKLIVVK